MKAGQTKHTVEELLAELASKPSEARQKAIRAALRNQGYYLSTKKPKRLCPQCGNPWPKSDKYNKDHCRNCQIILETIKDWQ